MSLFQSENLLFPMNDDAYGMRNPDGSIFGGMPGLSAPSLLDGPEPPQAVNPLLGGLLGGYAGLLSPEDRQTTINRGLLGLASGLLAASGPSTRKTSIGQAIGNSIPQAFGMADAYGNRQSANELAKRRMEQIGATERSPYYKDIYDAKGNLWTLNARTGQLSQPIVSGNQQVTGATPTMSDGTPLTLEGSAPLTGAPFAPNLQKDLSLYKGRGKGQSELEYAGPINYAQNIGRTSGEQDAKFHQTAINASDQIAKIDDLMNHLKTSEAITGLGAEYVKNVERFKASFLADKKAGKKVADTEILDAMMGSEVFPLIGALGIGARGLDTPAEREFLRSVMTGAIPLTKETLIRMTEIRRNVATRAIDRYNKRVEKGELDNYFKLSGRTKEKIEIGQPDAPTKTWVEGDYEYRRLPDGTEQRRKRQ